jgi:hypothetical protein
LQGEGFEVTKGETGKQVNLQSSLKNYEKLIKLQAKQSVETKKLVKINEDLKKVQDPKDLIKLL